MQRGAARMKLLYLVMPGFVIMLALPVLCLGDDIKKMDFKGKVTFECLKDNSTETFKCMSDYTASLTYKTEQGGVNQSCTISALRSNFTDGFSKSGCSLSYFLSQSSDKKMSLHFPKKSDLRQPPKCIGNLNITVNRKCHLLMTVEQMHFVQLCQTFGVRNAFMACKCDMFEIRYKGHPYSLCNILNATKNYAKKAISLTGKINKYESILKQSCLYLKPNKQCNCSDFQIIKGDEVKGFCPEKQSNIFKGLKELCKHFNISLDKCHCGLFTFNKTTEDTVCDFIDHKIVSIQYKSHYLIPYAVVETVASVIGIFGNSLVILVAFRFRCGLATCKHLIAHLAVYDLCFACTQLVYAIPRFWTSEFKYGKIVCKMLRSADNLGTFLAIGVILIISIERFTGIVNPFRRGFTRKSIRWILLANLIFSLSAIVPLLIYYDVDDQFRNCKAKWADVSHGIAYSVSILVIYLCIPVLLIAVLYAIIIATLRGTVVMGNTDFIADPRIREKRIQDNRRTMYVLISVVVAFVIFVFPKYIVNIYLAREGWSDYVSSKEMSIGNFFALVYISHFSYPFHVAVNPLIYSLIDSRWRKDAYLFLTGAQTRRRSAYSATMTSTMTANRRRSSAATILGDQIPNRRTTQLNNNNNCLSNKTNLIVTKNGDAFKVLPIPTPIRQTPLDIGFKNSQVWRGEVPSIGSSLTSLSNQ